MPNDEIIDLLSIIKKEAHEKAIYPCIQGTQSYITLNDLDGIIQRYANKYVKPKSNNSPRWHNELY